MKKYFLVTLIILLLSGLVSCQNNNTIISKEATVLTTLTTNNITTLSSNSMTTFTSINTTINKTTTQSTNVIETPKKEAYTFTILATGDNMLHSDNLKSGYDINTDTYSFTDFYKYVKPYIKKADIAIANFETVVAGEESGYTSFPSFNSPDSFVSALKDTGFDMLVTANNHCLDRGVYGISRTLLKIKENDLLSVGTNSDENIKWTDQYINDLTIRTLAYTYGCNGLLPILKEEEKYMVNVIDENTIKNHIDKAKDDGVDLIILYMHWGAEYNLNPAMEIEILAENLLYYGADIIYATHPHVVQKNEIINIDGVDKYVIYSMGNFISNFRREDYGQRANKLYTEDGVMVLTTFNVDVEDNITLKSVEHIPTWVHKYIDNDKIEYRIIPIENEEKLKTKIYEDDIDVEYMFEEALASYNRSFERLTDY